MMVILKEQKINYMNKLFMLAAINAALVIFCVNPAAAQWNSGFGIYNTAGGQVGIGTNNPTATLTGRIMFLTAHTSCDRWKR
jgi:hypothetical protein